MGGGVGGSIENASALREFPEAARLGRISRRAQGHSARRAAPREEAVDLGGVVGLV